MKTTASEDFIIRNYRRRDYPEVSMIWEETGMGHPDRGDDDRTIRRCNAKGGCFLVLEQVSTGKLCGTSWITFDGRRMHLHHFGILPEFQGNGLSKILLKQTLEFVRKKGYQVKLEVLQTNFKAINLYKEAGFRYLGDFDVYIIRNLSEINMPEEVAVTGIAFDKAE